MLARPGYSPTVPLSRGAESSHTHGRTRIACGRLRSSPRRWAPCSVSLTLDHASIRRISPNSPSSPIGAAGTGSETLSSPAHRICYPYKYIQNEANRAKSSQKG